MKKPNALAGILLALLVAAVALGACGAESAPAPAAGEPASHSRPVSVAGAGSYTDVDAAGLAAMLDNKDFPLINVHIPYEGEIGETDAFIPYDEIKQHLDQLPAKDARIVLYCRSDRMSNEAAQELVKLGYTDVWNLDGGMIAWEQAGYPLLDKGQ
jgi:rhodanese-related sulfurtransferase